LSLSSKPTGSRGLERKRRIEQEKKKETAAGTAILFIVVVLVAAAAWYFVPPLLSSPSGSKSVFTGNPTLSTCISEGNLAMHIHVRVRIVINGALFTIPANVGVTSTCTRPVHTHDDSGEIHVESPVVYSYTLGDFFLVWGQPFDSIQIFQYKVDSTHALVMTVNGQVNSQFQNYVIHDEDEVQITYGSST